MLGGTVPARHRIRIALGALLALAVLQPLGTAGAAEPGFGFDGDPATTERLAVGNPTVMAAAVSQQRFGAGEAAHVVLSRDDAFPDSLAGSPLTGTGPLLLTASSSLTPLTRDEVVRVLPPRGTVYVLGGVQAVSDEVTNALAGEGFTVRRLAGSGRVETAVAIADEVIRLSPTPDVVLARAAGPADVPSAGWADSVTGGAYAARFGIPVLITPSDELAGPVGEALARYGTGRTFLLGGPAALSEDVAGGVPGPQRIFGADRAETAAGIARVLWPPGRSRYLLVEGYRDDGWAYGLAAAGLAADAEAPILVSGPDDVPPPSLSLLSAPCGTPPATDALLIGDESILAASVPTRLQESDGPACPPPPPPEVPPVRLRSDGLGFATFGSPMAPVLDRLLGFYGDPEDDTGWQPSEDYGCFGANAEIRIYTWGGLDVFFDDDVVGSQTGSPRFVGWISTLAPPDVATEAGIRVGSTVEQVEAAYGDVVYDDDIFGASFSVSPGPEPGAPADSYFFGGLSSTAASGTVEVLLSVPCGE